jgi:hypothetical protein
MLISRITLLASALMLSACELSQSGNFSFACKGNYQKTEYANLGETRVKQLSAPITKDYTEVIRFKSKKYDTGYDCDWNPERVICQREKIDGNLKAESYLRIVSKSGDMLKQEETLESHYFNDPSAPDKFTLETVDGNCERVKD